MTAQGRSYLVSTSPSGRKLWWRPSETIPADHTDIRPATPQEAVVMDKIVLSRGAPSQALAERIQRMLGRP